MPFGFTGKRVVATWNDPSFNPAGISEKLNELGFVCRPFDPSHSRSRTADAAWPEYVSSAPQVEHAELQRQADEALEIARLRLQTEPQGL